MKIIYNLLFIILFLTLTSCKSQQWPFENFQGEIKLQTLLVVDLQTGYKGEIIKLWINDENVIDGSRATTVPESSFTGIKVSFFKGVGNLVPEIVHKFDNNSNDVANSPISIGPEVTIRIRVEVPNGKMIEHATKIKLDKGKYIGLSLSGPGQALLIRQNQDPFSYL